MTTCEYLTARCPDGCEVWLHPKAVAPHATRCKGEPWTGRRRNTAEVLVGNEAADLARSLLPPEVLHKPNFGGDRLVNPRPGQYLRDGVVQGVVVRSPLDGVTGRRWWTVARTAIEAGEGIEAAFDQDGFDVLEAKLGLVGRLVRCGTCGDDVTTRALGRHQATNSVCRFLANIAEVHTFWDLGYRDPYSLRNQGVPLAWGDLQRRVCWRNRLHIVRFQRWTAVLIATS